MMSNSLDMASLLLQGIVDDLAELSPHRRNVWAAKFNLQHPEFDDAKFHPPPLGSSKYALSYESNQIYRVYNLLPISKSYWDKIRIVVRGHAPLEWLVELLYKQPLPAVNLRALQALWYKESGQKIPSHKIHWFFDKEDFTDLLHAGGLPFKSKIIEDVYWLAWQKKFTSRADTPYTVRKLTQEEIDLIRAIYFTDREAKIVRDFFISTCGVEILRQDFKEYLIKSAVKLVNVAFKKYKTPFHIAPAFEYGEQDRVQIGYKLVFLLGDDQLGLSGPHSANFKLQTRKRPKGLASMMLWSWKNYKEEIIFLNLDDNGYFQESEIGAFMVFTRAYYFHLQPGEGWLLPNPCYDKDFKKSISQIFKSMNEENFVQRYQTIQPKIVQKNQENGFWEIITT